MLRRLLRASLDRFARRWDYDVSYGKDILDADPHAFIAFALATGIGSYRRDLPRDAWYTAKIVTALDEDCGPCTQLVVSMAEQDGVKPEVLRAVLAGDLAVLPADVALAWRYADAVRRRSPDSAELREAVFGSWGARGLVSLAFAITVARLYPTVKYALGHGHACQRITIGGTTQPVFRRAA